MNRILADKKKGSNHDHGIDNSYETRFRDDSFILQAILDTGAARNNISSEVEKISEDELDQLLLDNIGHNVINNIEKIMTRRTPSYKQKNLIQDAYFSLHKAHAIKEELLSYKTRKTKDIPLFMYESEKNSYLRLLKIAKEKYEAYIKN